MVNINSRSKLNVKSHWWCPWVTNQKSTPSYLPFCHWAQAVRSEKIPKVARDLSEASVGWCARVLPESGRMRFCGGWEMMRIGKETCFVMFPTFYLQVSSVWAEAVELQKGDVHVIIKISDQVGEGNSCHGCHHFGHRCWTVNAKLHQRHAMICQICGCALETDHVWYLTLDSTLNSPCHDGS